MTDLQVESPSHAHRLRSYIAPAAPATRAPCDGHEAVLRVEFGFTPRWFSERCGIDFSERWHVDALYRRATCVTMRHELNRRFPALRLGGADPDASRATLDGLHGAMTVAGLFGLPIRYTTNNWPVTTGADLSAEAIMLLDVPDLTRVPLFAQVIEQMELIEREYGRVEGYLNWQGVLNNAYRLRGADILTDLVTDASLARHLFEVIARTMIEGMRYVYARQKQTGVVVEHASVSNCLVNMVSPELYVEHLLPFDTMISDAFRHFGIHNCAWNVDPYIEAYAGIRTLGYVDMGFDSDLARVRRLCPDTRRAVMYAPGDLTGKTLDEIRADLTRIYRDLGPCDIVMADIDHETPDDRVVAFARMADEISAAGAEGGQTYLRQ